MKIGIAAPTEVHSFKPFLPKNLHELLPKGTGGTMIPTYLAEGLISRGHQVSIYTLDASIKESQVFHGEHITIYVGRYRNPARYRMLDLFKEESATIRGFIEQDQPDVVNAHWTYEYALGALATEVPTLIVAHDAPFQILRYSTDLYRFVRLIMAWKAIRKAKNLAAISPYVADHIKNWFFYKKPINIIPIGIDIRKYESFYSTYNEKKDKLLYFSIANGWGKLKNEKRLLYAFSKVHLRNSNTELWMFGIDHGAGEIANNWAERRGLSTGVKFMGKRNHSELMETMAREADVLVHPSLEESFGNIFLEAGLYGKAIIAGNNSGAVPSILGYGKAGLLIDVRSIKQLEDAMNELAQNDALRKHLGDQAREYVYENYSLNRMLDLYEDAYNKIASYSNNYVEQRRIGEI